MTIQRGHNARRQAGVIGAEPIALEMAALEDLGPKTRFAICNAPISVLAARMVSQVIERNDQIEAENVARAAAGEPPLPYIDPKDPVLDTYMAKAVMELGINTLLRDRSLEDALAGIRPLRARRVRVGRRAYR